ncbi:UNVERIFIED_CONTAM: hypothetical protein Slati_3950200 [Sesamum latifolium]|uniref:Transposase MuDR plant domain-containing protein n=1 Tax=Sesamum latifolium TaxID=2727402 RepID=A0AAW2TN47_9LAMI
MAIRDISIYVEQLGEIDTGEGSVGLPDEGVVRWVDDIVTHNPPTESDEVEDGSSGSSKGRKMFWIFDPTFLLGMLFSTKSELKKAIQSHAIKTKRHIICTKSDPNMYYAKCGDKKCAWSLHARKMKDECTFQIRNYNPKHTCSKTFNFKNVKSSWLCDKYLDKFKSDPKRTVKGFRMDAVNEIRCHISRDQAYRAKRRALKNLEGSPEYQYSRLWDYVDEIRRTNPESTVILGTEDVGGENRFSRFYVYFGALKIGFGEGCRKIIGVDGCHLKRPNGGILLTAVGVDPNNNLYPISYAVVNREARETWEWFLILLNEDLGISNQVEKWDLTGIPCKHANSAICNQKDDPEDYVADCYSVQTYKRVYASAIMPIGGDNMWTESCFIPPLPPNFGRRSGRPSRARRRDPDEPMMKIKKGKRSYMEAEKATDHS